MANCRPPRPRGSAGLCAFAVLTMRPQGPGKLLAGPPCPAVLQGCQPRLLARTVRQGDAGAQRGTGQLPEHRRPTGSCCSPGFLAAGVPCWCFAAAAPHRHPCLAKSLGLPAPAPACCPVTVTLPVFWRSPEAPRRQDTAEQKGGGASVLASDWGLDHSRPGAGMLTSLSIMYMGSDAKDAAAPKSWV